MYKALCVCVCARAPERERERACMQIHTHLVTAPEIWYKRLHIRICLFLVFEKIVLVTLGIMHQVVGW